MTFPPRLVLPILCEFWQEDGVWNAVTKDLPISVFGDSFEDAQAHLRDAIQGHLESAIEVGDFPDLLERMSKLVSAKKFSLDDMQTSHPVLKMSAVVKDNQVAVA